MKGCAKQRSYTEFFHGENINQHLLNVYGNETVDVNTVE